MLCVSSFPVVAAAVVVLSILYCRQDAAACVVLTVVLSKTAVPSQHLRRVVVVAASVLGVQKAMAVVWSRVAVVPGEASVRSSTAGGRSQETSVGAAVVVLVYRPRRQAVDISAAVEAVVCSPLPVFVVPRGDRWSASRFHSLMLLSLQVEREGSVFGDQFVMSYLGPFTIITKLFQQECQARTFPSDCF